MPNTDMHRSNLSSVECTDELCSFQYDYQLTSTFFLFQWTPRWLFILCSCTSVSPATSRWVDRWFLAWKISSYYCSNLPISSYIIISFVMLQFDWTIPAFVIMCISLPAAAISGGTFFISSLPFIIDQMIGASADDIIAAIHWYCWAFAVGVAAQYLPILHLLHVNQGTLVS